MLQWAGLRSFDVPPVGRTAVPTELPRIKMSVGSGVRLRPRALLTVSENDNRRRNGVLTPARQSIHQQLKLGNGPRYEGHGKEDSMKNPALIVSDPPQHQPDYQAAAPVFWLSPTEIQMKSNYSIPEKWFADEEDEAISATAGYLTEAGFRIKVLHGQDIADVQSQQSVSSFLFEDAGLILNLGGNDLELEYDLTARSQDQNEGIEKTPVHTAVNAASVNGNTDRCQSRLGRPRKTCSYQNALLSGSMEAAR